jgi:hypothetical protein
MHTAWDLGIGDATAIWFFQIARDGLRVVDYYENHGQGLPHYAAELAARGYSYGIDYLPHDAAARELGTGRSLQETLRQLTKRHPRILPAQNVMDGINAARVTIGSVPLRCGAVRPGARSAAPVPGRLRREAENLPRQAQARLGIARGRRVPLPLNGLALAGAGQAQAAAAG